MTTYSLVLAGTTAPTVEQLTRAFAFTDALRSPDAAKLAHEVRGILLKNLTYDVAYRVQAALREDGVATEILESQALPTLPESKLTRRLEFTDTALMVYDVLGRATPIEWSALAVVAAGAVGHYEVTTTRTEEQVITFSPIRGFRPQTVSETAHTVESKPQLLLDLLVSEGQRRFQVEAKGFLFGYCFNRPELTLEEKFVLLVQMIVERAPHAARNWGAEAMVTGVGIESYASKVALQDEMVWLLWWMCRPKPGQG
jgi:hypothetical protein